MSPRIESSTPVRTASPTHLRYAPGPALGDVRSAGAALSRGHSGEGVRELQAMLNAAGIEPRLAEDGLFGPKTQAALRQLQARCGLRETGVLDAPTLSALEHAHAARPPRAQDGDVRQPTSEGDTVAPARRTGEAPRAPRYGGDTPAGTVPAGQLARADDARLQRRSNEPSAPSRQPPQAPPQGPAAPATPTPIQVDPAVGPGAARADAELAQLQRRTMDAARTDLAAGVREDHRVGDNRGPRIDQYARDAGMTPGGEWCGYFSSFQYSEAARSAGGTFAGRHHMHSMQKARSFFEYRSYTDASASTNSRLDNLRAQHEADGSTRRWMTLEGSGGQRHAAQGGRPHEVHQPSTLPIREGDTAIFSRGHVGLVESYDRASGRLVTIEGNTGGGRVARREYNLNDPADRARFEGFGRPARSDFTTP